MKYLEDTKNRTMNKKSIYQKILSLPKKNIYHDKGYLIRYIEQEFKLKDYSILDIGAGDGVMLSHAYNSKNKIVFDIDNYYKKYFENLNWLFYKVNIGRDKFPLNDNSLDVITINHVIEHIHNYKNLMQECKRVLKPGGLLVITTPNINASRLRLDFWNGRPTMFNFWDDPTHIKPYTITSIKRLFSMFDFNIKKIGHTPPLEYVLLCLLVSNKLERYLNKYYEKIGRSNILIVGVNKK
jgi:2-polyprenyl-3-methyl-5-hydroxy-6-metoxy-1,4-benzoquinol methylase